MDTTPKDFMNINASEFKKMYRDLSRKYHPDKNVNDTTDKFMKLKQAFETISDPEKRVLYDVFAQVNFDNDDRMADVIGMRIKNKTEREEQVASYKRSRTAMRVFGEVFPYYFTWLLLTYFRVDRDNAFNILLALTVIVGAFEV